MSDATMPVLTKPKQKKKRSIETPKRTRRTRYIVAALKAASAICEGRTKMELHPALRLEAAKLIAAIENGVSLPTVNDRLLRKIIAEEIATGDINQTLLRMSGLLDKVETNQKKAITPLLEQASKQIAETEQPTTAQLPEPQPVHSPPSAPPKADQISESLKEALRKLESGVPEVSLTPVSQSAPVPAPTPVAPKPTTPAPTVSTEPYLSEDELSAINKFSQLRISASELEAELKPFLKIEWGGLDRDRITSVSFTGARIATEDRVTITPALMERAQNLALSPSPRDQQLVREWAQMITKTPLFVVGTDVLMEIVWLKQQLNL